MAHSNYGSVSVIQPPSLKQVDQPSLIKFETEFSAYRNKVDGVNSDRDEENKLQPATIKDCMDSNMLHALCLMGEIEGASSVEEATPEKVSAWFNNAATVSPRDISERLEAVLKAIQYSPNKEDPAGGVANFMLEVIIQLDKYNISEILEDSDMAKKLLDKLVGKFEPPVLKERIKMRRSGWNKAQLSDIKLFKNEISALAVEVSLTEVARERVKPRGNLPKHRRDTVRRDSWPGEKKNQKSEDSKGKKEGPPSQPEQSERTVNGPTNASTQNATGSTFSSNVRPLPLKRRRSCLTITINRRNRKKKGLRNIYLSNSWGTNHDAAFNDIKSQLVASVKLAHPKANYSTCLFTDASDTHWAPARFTSQIIRTS